MTLMFCCWLSSSPPVIFYGCCVIRDFGAALFRMAYLFCESRSSFSMITEWRCVLLSTAAECEFRLFVSISMGRPPCGSQVGRLRLTMRISVASEGVLSVLVTDASDVVTDVTFRSNLRLARADDAEPAGIFHQLSQWLRSSSAKRKV